MSESKLIVFRDEFVSIDFDEKLQKYILSLPVSNGMVDYEEDYEISEAEYNHFREKSGYADLMALRQLCQDEKADDRLLRQPSIVRRGIAKPVKD